MSNSVDYPFQNYEHNVFKGISIRPNQENIFSEFLGEQDISPHSIQALVMDIRKFAMWFSTANSEPWDIGRITVRDVTDFREYLRQEKRQAVNIHFASPC